MPAYVMKNRMIGFGPEWEYITYSKGWEELGRFEMTPATAWREFAGLRSVSPWEFYRGAVCQDPIADCGVLIQ